MTLGLRERLFLFSVLLLVLFGGFLSWQIERRVGDAIEATTEQDLDRYAVLAAELLAESASSPDELADRLGERIHRRVTVIGFDGQVLGDSERDGDALAAMDNHRARPEVALVLDHQAHGHARRYSHTLGQDMLYTAVPEPGGDRVMRVSMPANDAPIRALRGLLLGTAVLGLLVAAGLSALASHQVTRGLRDALDRAGEGPDAVAAVNALVQQQRRSIEELAAERNRFQRVLDGMREGLVLLAADGSQITANRRGRDLLASQRLDELPLVDETEISLSGFTVQVQVTELEDGAQLVLLRDVTDLKRLLTMRQDFVANVSHELRTPVSVIRTNVDALQAGAMEEPELANSFLEAIDRNASRLGALIADLLSLASLDGGERLELEELDCGELAWRVRESLWESADGRGQDLRLEVPLGLRVWANPGAVEQILTNFLENAIKYCPEGSQVEVRASEAGRRVRLEVHDNGSGVPEDARDRVFERFYRLDKGRSRQVGGTGLGLSIVRHLAQAMGGSVGVVTSPLGGACFWLEVQIPPSTT